MKQWIEKYYWMGGLIIAAMVIAMIVFWIMPVSAAAPQFPECPQVAIAGGIKIYYCDKTIVDSPFFVNQLGWMMPEPY